VTGIDVLQDLTDLLFVGIFLVVAVHALRHPRRATIDAALFFAAFSFIVLYTVVAPPLHLAANALAVGLVITVLLAAPYLLLRLADGFTTVPSFLSRGAAAGFVLVAVSALALPASLRPMLTVPYIVYFVGLTLYSSVAFVRAGRRATGVTRRRLQAVAFGSACLGVAILLSPLRPALPGLVPLWNVLNHLLGLGAGVGYFLGFAPPAWLRRAWQEPELRAFLGRAALLPRLPNTEAIVAALEGGAAASLGAPHAYILLWDAASQALRRTAEGASVSVAPGEMIAGRCFAAQRALFVADAARAYPDRAQEYRASGALAVLAAPISAGQRRLGVLAVAAARPSIFAEDDLVLVQLLADQAAVILESRHLIDEAARVHAREEATRLKDDFLSAAAHDLKTPLTGLLGQAQLMQRRVARDPTAPADGPGVDRLVADAQRLHRLVLDLLDVARVEQGRLVGPCEPVDLVPLAAEAARPLETPLHRIVIAAEGPVVAQCDGARVLQLLTNLLENAVKYSPEGGEIRVRVWASGAEAHLRVEDEGIGIPPGDLPHLFERFHRGGNVDDRAFAGMGLGLYFCHAIAEQHGGRLEATSAGPGRGSAFEATFPLVAAPQESRPEGLAERVGLPADPVA
jgi:signal transduction histidine kinase